MTNHIYRQLALLAFVLLSARYAGAQSAVDVHFGGGVVTDKSNGQSYDTFDDGSSYSASSLDSPVLTFGGAVLFKRHFGAGANFTFSPGKKDYAGLKFRPLFYDFNGVWTPPLGSKRIVPILEAGIGGVSTRFYYDYGSSGCEFYGCTSSSSYYVSSSNHFQEHLGAGVQMYVTDHIYFKPQFDLRHVHNFTEQFNSDWVPQYTLALGYHFGEK